MHSFLEGGVKKHELFVVSQVMLDTVGPELQVVNKSEKAISLVADSHVVLTPDQEQEASSDLLPINFIGLSKASNFLLHSMLILCTLLSMVFSLDSSCASCIT